MSTQPSESTLKTSDSGWDVRSRQILVLCFALGFVLRVLHLITLTRGPYFNVEILDSLYHDLWARHFADGTLPQEPFFRAPLYPTLLGCIYWLLGRDLFMARLLGIFLGLGTVFFTLRIGERLFDRKTALVAAVVLLLYGPFIFFDSELLLECALVFFIFLSLLLLVRALAQPERPFLWFADGLCFGLVAITRPNVLIFIPVLIAWLFWRNGRKSLQYVLLLLVGVGIVVGGVTARNYVVGKDGVLIASQGGINFYIGNNPEADGYTSKTPLGFNWYGDYQDSVALFSKKQAEKETGRPMKASEISRFWFQKGFDFWRTQPREALALLLKKTYLFWNAYEIKNNKDYYFQKRFSWVLRLPLFSFGVVSVFGLIGMVLRLRHIRPEVTRKTEFLLLLFVIVYMVSVVPFFVCDRYRLPIVPALALFGSYGVLWFGRAVSGRRWKDVSVALCAIIAMGVLLRLDPYGVKPKDYADEHWSAGNSYQESGRLDKSIEEYREALSEKPNYVDAWNNLGNSYYALKEYPQAIESYQKAIDCDSEYARAYSNLGRSYLVMSQLEKALSSCQKAVNLAKGNAIYRNGLGEVLLALGRHQEALVEFAKAVVLYPDFSAGYRNLGEVYLKLGENQRALEVFEKALKLNPADAVAKKGIQAAADALAGSAVSR